MTDPNLEAKQTHAAATTAALAAVYAEARADVLAQVQRAGDVLGVLRDIWRTAVRSTAAERMKTTAESTGKATSEAYSPERAANYLDAVADSFADTWRENLQDNLDEIAAKVDAKFADVLAEVEARTGEMVAKAAEDGQNITELSANFGSFEAATMVGRTTKTWHLGASDNHRPSHVALDGTTIGIDERFANGLRYPHSPGPPAEVLNCNCYLTFGGA